MSLTIASIETSVSNLFHAALKRAAALEAGIASAAGMVVKGADAVTHVVDDVAPFAASVLAIAAPQDAAAVTVVKTMVDAMDAAIDAAGAAAAGGVTVSLSAELVAAFQAGKAALVKFESTI